MIEVPMNVPDAVLWSMVLSREGRVEEANRIIDRINAEIKRREKNEGLYGYFAPRAK